MLKCKNYASKCFQSFSMLEKLCIWKVKSYKQYIFVIFMTYFLSSLFLSKIAHEINLRILSPNNCSSSWELVSKNSNMTIHHKHSFHGRLKRTLRHATTEIFNARNITTFTTFTLKRLETMSGVCNSAIVGCELETLKYVCQKIGNIILCLVNQLLYNKSTQHWSNTKFNHSIFFPHIFT